MKQIGEGIIKQSQKGVKRYEGTLPFEKNEQVCLISKQDLDTLVENAVFTVTINRLDMDKEFYSTFPDFITMTEENEKYKLFLDRHLYAMCFKDCIWIRYTSVDEAFAEGEL